MNLKVLMFGWEFPPFNSGGLGTACLGLTKALVSQKVEVVFVLPKKIDVKLDNVNFCFANEKPMKVKYHVVKSFLSPYYNETSYQDAYYQQTQRMHYGPTLLDEVLRYAEEAKKIAVMYQFDIIHAHDWMSFKAGIAAKEISGKPLIVHIHSTEIDRTGGLNINQTIYDIEKEGMEKADKVVAVSQWTKDLIVKRYGIPEDKIWVIHNGVRLDDYTKMEAVKSDEIHSLKKAGYKIVLFAGRITIQKGPDYFIKAAKIVSRFYPKVMFVVAGAGDMENTMIEEAARLGITDKVLFTGFLRGRELMQIYQMADLFVMPSVSEPFGITALEAVINKTPVLISKQSGVKEVLSHALVVDFWDTEEMANKILAVLNYDSLKLSLGENGYHQARSINWDKAANNLLQVYRSVLDHYFG